MFLTSRLTMTKLCASSEISFDSANLGLSAKGRKQNRQRHITLHYGMWPQIWHERHSGAFHHTFTGTAPGLVNEDHQRQPTKHKKSMKHIVQLKFITKQPIMQCVPCFSLPFSIFEAPPVNMVAKPFILTQTTDKIIITTGYAPELQTSHVTISAEQRVLL